MPIEKQPLLLFCPFDSGGRYITLWQLVRAELTRCKVQVGLQPVQSTNTRLKLTHNIYSLGTTYVGGVKAVRGLVKAHEAFESNALCNPHVYEPTPPG